MSNIYTLLFTRHFDKISMFTMYSFEFQDSQSLIAPMYHFLTFQLPQSQVLWEVLQTGKKKKPSDFRGIIGKKRKHILMVLITLLKLTVWKLLTHLPFQSGTREKVTIQKCSCRLRHVLSWGPMFQSYLGN